MKPYTSSGDDGYTGLLGEGRVPKWHIRLEALGNLDESSAMLGMARASCGSPERGALLLAIQRDLYHMMAEVAATPENAGRFRTIDAARVNWLEGQAEALATGIEIPTGFILPGDSLGGATLALARSVVRRAERCVTRLLHEGQIENGELVRYLNRLSSLCFLLELIENQAAGVQKPSMAES